ncbi:hypothetical protein [Bacillus sp. T33-2]|uniref:hypothetical protein n=1 Tax=Bacillus sp. T33-2 TaxID=2054168 RepID=UPI0015E0778B|nr:hypothetical protein [Bacillus sp. T33-2]
MEIFVVTAKHKESNDTEVGYVGTTAEYAFNSYDYYKQHKEYNAQLELWKDGEFLRQI